MANIKISQLPEASQLTGEDVMMVIQNMTNKQSPLRNILTYNYKLILTSAVTAGTAFTIPCYYKVGQDILDVYYNGENLILSSDDVGTDGHYREVGEAGTISNQIKTTIDWGLSSGDYLEFIVRGVWS